MKRIEVYNADYELVDHVASSCMGDWGFKSFVTICRSPLLAHPSLSGHAH